VPANAADSLYCMQLAQNAVHGASKFLNLIALAASTCSFYSHHVHCALLVAGYTGFSVGLVNNHIVYLPMPQLVAASPRSLNPNGQTWERVLAMTGQPNTAKPRAEPVDVTGDFPSLPEPTVH